MKQLSLSKLTILFSLIVLSLVVLTQISSFNFYPQFIDDYYHLFTAESFNQAGGWLSINPLDYAPQGRVNIYPPIYHLLISSLLNLGIDKILILKILPTVIGIIFFLVLWWTSNLLFGITCGFFSILIGFSFFPLLSGITANIPASLALIISFLAIIALKKNKHLTFCLLVSICAYTHIGISLAFNLALISAFFLKEFKPARKFLILGLVLCLPLYWHQLSSLSYIKVSKLQENQFIQYNLLIITLTPAFFIYSLRKKSFYILIGLYTLFLFLVFFKHPFRFFSSQAAVLMGIPTAVILALIIERKKSLVLFLIIIAYVFCFNLSFIKTKQNLLLHNSATIPELFNPNQAEFNEFRSLYFKDIYQDFAKAIEENSQKQDIISSNLSFLSVVLGSITQRPIGNSIFPEVLPLRKENFLKNSKIIIWVKNPDQKDYLPDKLFDNYKTKNNLKKIYSYQESEIYLNPKAHPIVLPKATIKFPMILLIFLSIVVMIIYDLIKTRQS